MPAPAERDAADVDSAPTVRVADSTSGVDPSDGDGAADAASVDPVEVTDAEAEAEAVAVARGDGEAAAVEPPPDDVAVLAGRLADVRDALEVAGRGADGGRMAGGLPAPNAQPSTVPAFGWVEAAPDVL